MKLTKDDIIWEADHCGEKCIKISRLQQAIEELKEEGFEGVWAEDNEQLPTSYDVVTFDQIDNALGGVLQ